MAFTKKATPSTEVVLGAAVVGLRKTTTELKSVVDTVLGLADKAEELQGKIAEQEGRISELQVTYEEKKRALEVQLDLDFKSDSNKAVESILAPQGKISISKQEYDALLSSYQQLKSDMQKEISKEVAIVTNRMKSEADNERKLLEAQYTAKEAQTTAELSTMKNQIAFLTSQVELWKGALDKERDAGVERSKNSAIGNLNLGTSQK